MQMWDYFDVFNYVVIFFEVDFKKIVYWGMSMLGGNVFKVVVLNKNIVVVIVQVFFILGEWVVCMVVQFLVGFVLE